MTRLRAIPGGLDAHPLAATTVRPGRRLVGEPSSHVSVRPPVERPAFYDHEAEDLTPLMIDTALSVLIATGARSASPQVREAARVVKIARSRHQHPSAPRHDDDCPPRGIPRPKGGAS